MTPVSKAPDNLNALRTEIADRFESLSPRLKQVAIYALDNPNDMALETLVVIAGHCETQPSTIVRFAKQFGYRGASEMQRVFRDQLFNMEPTLSYQERIRRFNAQLESPEEISALKLLREFSASNIIALEHFSQEASNAKLTRAIKAIDKAETVYIIGMRRSTIFSCTPIFLRVNQPLVSTVALLPASPRQSRRSKARQSTLLRSVSKQNGRILDYDSMARFSPPMMKTFEFPFRRRSFWGYLTRSRVKNCLPRAVCS